MRFAPLVFIVAFLPALGISREVKLRSLRAAERKVDDLLALALMPTFLPFVPAYVGDKS